MRVRQRAHPEITGTSHGFNTHGLGEIIVGFDGGDMDSQYLRDYEVFLEAKQEWKWMPDAFKDQDLISDNYNTTFHEPRNEAERARGYSI